MKNTTKFLKYIMALLAVFTFGCEAVDLDQLQAPNSVSEEQLDPVYVFNYIQIVLPQFVDSANDFTQQLTRQMAMTGGRTYDNAFSDVSFNSNWITGYSILTSVKLLEKKAEALKETNILGASKIIRAYVMMTLVDLYGDVPYSEAFLGNENLNPKFDKSAEVYKTALKELDDALIILDQTNSGLEENKAYDLYYGTGLEKNFNVAKWKTLANTLKFKAYITARKAGTEIGVDIPTALTTLMAGDLIDTPAEDFTFKYSTSLNPDSRHPLFVQSYYSNNSPPYIANYMMWTMVREKGVSSILPTNADKVITDPRVRFYFYNQTDNAELSDTFELPCKTSIRPEQYNFAEYASLYKSDRLTPFCTTKKSANSTNTGFWGADHGYSSGRPNDGAKITIAGLYPAGGDLGGSSSPQNAGATAGEKGAGIMPIMLSSFVRFMKAEAYHAVFNDPAAAKTEMDLAILASIEKASTLFSGYDSDLPTATEKTDYLKYVDDFYTNNPSKQLEIIIKEYYIAAWGNGIEVYNNYRRTGFPSNLQPTLETYPGDFYNTVLYPSISTANNENKPENLSRTRRTFWDVNSPILH